MHHGAAEPPPAGYRAAISGAPLARSAAGRKACPAGGAGGALTSFSAASVGYLQKSRCEVKRALVFEKDANKAQQSFTNALGRRGYFARRRVTSRRLVRRETSKIDA